MARYKITKTLLESYSYMFDCAEGFEDDAYADFLKTLNREKTEPNEAMLNGLAFERDVYKVANCNPNIDNPKWEAGIEQVARIIRGAQIQVRDGRDLELDGMTFWVYGILDALKAGVIYDVKFMNKSMNSVDVYGKYLTCSQHPAYFYIIPEATEFQYLVSDGSSLYVERYAREDTPHISEYIRPFIQYLTETGLLETYKKKWLVDE